MPTRLLLGTTGLEMFSLLHYHQRPVRPSNPQGKTSPLHAIPHKHTSFLPPQTGQHSPQPNHSHRRPYNRPATDRYQPTPTETPIQLPRVLTGTTAVHQTHNGHAFSFQGIPLQNQGHPVLQTILRLLGTQKHLPTLLVDRCFFPFRPRRRSSEA